MLHTTTSIQPSISTTRTIVFSGSLSHLVRKVVRWGSWAAVGFVLLPFLPAIALAHVVNYLETEN